MEDRDKETNEYKEWQKYIPTVEAQYPGTTVHLVWMDRITGFMYLRIVHDLTEAQESITTREHIMRDAPRLCKWLKKQDALAAARMRAGLDVVTGKRIEL